LPKIEKVTSNEFKSNRRTTEINVGIWKKLHKIQVVAKEEPKRKTNDAAAGQAEADIS